MFWQDYLPNPIFFSIGPFIVHWYGLILVLAIIMATWQAKKYFIKKNILTSSQFEDLSFYIIIFGLLGARFGHIVFFNFFYYLHNPVDIFKVWQGGMSIHGALFFGILTVFFWSRRHKINFWKMADGLALAVPLGQAIGRWGNYFNQELFGKPTSAWWGIPIAPINRVSGYEDFNYFQPIFFYESLACLILFIILYKLIYNNTFKKGTLTLFYFIGYAFIRLMIEFVRIDETAILFGMRMGQIISIVIILLALAFVYQLYMKPLSKQQK
ncbi:MAG: prolipoprotein diacylglyceryl transferase [Patescibacteria group bacterium]|jgi:phosphatidylglycerol:prolipoprotein diacylglycerol transferase